MYELTKDDTLVRRLSDGAFIPADPANRDYLEYLAWRTAGNEPAPLPLPALDTVAAEALRRINAASQAEMDAISAKYPPFEVQTWTDQEREARAWTADAATLTPLLGPIAEARGITLADLVGRVIAKADAYRAAVAACIGKRQKLEDDIAAAVAAEDRAALDAVVWA